MPELPEVTTIVNQLQKEIVGSMIDEVESVEGYRTEPEIGEFKKRSKGLKVLSVERVAKTIVINLSEKGEAKSESRAANRPSPEFVVIHLAMTGRLLLRPVGVKLDPWARLIFRLEKESPLEQRRLLAKELRFCDARLFGSVRLVTGDKLQEHKKKYGPDALDTTLDATKLLEQLKKRKTVVKRALLDQELIAGVGNIYANEALWLARIHPEAISTQVTSTQAGRLLEGLRQVLMESVEHRGSTLDDGMYVDLYGREGEHQKYFRIYGRAGQPCPRCQTKIEFLEIGGRATFSCPVCQVKSEPKTKVTGIGPVQTQLL